MNLLFIALPVQFPVYVSCEGCPLAEREKLKRLTCIYNGESCTVFEKTHKRAH